MFMRRVFLNILLGHLLITGAGTTCVPVQCLRCNLTGETVPCVFCPNNAAQCVDVPPDFRSNCTKDFQVSVNSTGSKLKEGDEITLTCVHNHPNLKLMFEWKKNNVDFQEGRNKSKLYFEKVWPHHGGQFMCIVYSSCGSSKSLPINVTVENESVILLIICGVFALVLVLILGMAMKYKLKRDSAKHRQRRLQKELEQRGGPASVTPRES